MNLPETVTAFGIILDEEQVPPRIYLVHNNADPLDDQGKEGKQTGWGLPGGGQGPEDEGPEFCEELKYLEELGYKPEDLPPPLRAALRETKRESGLVTEPGFYNEQAEDDGEILCDHKHWVKNTVYVFHLKKTDGRLGRIEEVDESGRVMLATLGSILTMPLAVKNERFADGNRRITKNPEGIYFSHRMRIVKALDAMGYDFNKLLPNLQELLPKIDPDEVGSYCYDVLIRTLQETGHDVTVKSSKAVISKSARASDEELVTRYSDAVSKPAPDPDEEYRRWAEKAFA